LTGNNVAMDSFGPISDNANGLAEMSQKEPVSEKGRQTLADLDAVGNTTKAITKGVAIGSAVIAAVSLFKSFTTLPQLVFGPSAASLVLDIANPLGFVGLLVGGAIPFLFSALCIKAVGRGAGKMVREVRRQFDTVPGLWEGKALPDYAECVGIATRTAQKELIGLGIVAILSPLLVGFLLGGLALGGFLAGAIIASMLLAIFMATSGGAWDNAKKTIEDGLYGGKGSEAHKAAVTGDTVGDPLKDTAGPALNPMMKVINLISLLIGPSIIASSLVQYPGLFQWQTISPWIIVLVIGLAVAIAIAVWNGKRETKYINKADGTEDLYASVKPGEKSEKPRTEEPEETPEED
jgi:K(+)-stimulated pyrophosphate-energized sodium pump